MKRKVAFIKSFPSDTFLGEFNFADSLIFFFFCIFSGNNFNLRLIKKFVFLFNLQYILQFSKFDSLFVQKVEIKKWILMIGGVDWDLPNRKATFPTFGLFSGWCCNFFSLEAIKQISLDLIALIIFSILEYTISKGDDYIFSSQQCHVTDRVTRTMTK